VHSERERGTAAGLEIFVPVIDVVKKLVFFAGSRKCMTLIGYKGLPQGSVLSPFLYNIIGSCVDWFIPSECGCGFF
jgi:hypothetical protein